MAWMHCKIHSKAPKRSRDFREQGEQRKRRKAEEKLDTSQEVESKVSKRPKQPEEDISLTQKKTKATPTETLAVRVMSSGLKRKFPHRLI